MRMRTVLLSITVVFAAVVLASGIFGYTIRDKFAIRGDETPELWLVVDSVSCDTEPDTLAINDSLWKILRSGDSITCGLWADVYYGNYFPCTLFIFGEGGGNPDTLIWAAQGSQFSSFEDWKSCTLLIMIDGGIEPPPLDSFPNKIVIFGFPKINLGASYAPVCTGFVDHIVGWADSAIYADTADYADTSGYAWEVPCDSITACSVAYAWMADTAQRADTLYGVNDSLDIVADSLFKVYSRHINMGIVGLATGLYAVVGGGMQNTASGEDATVGGGKENTASGEDATVGGGYDNTASDRATTVGGGLGNVASGYGATISGGFTNLAQARWSYAQGYLAKVYGDASDTCAMAFGTVVVDSSPYAIVFGDGLEDTSAMGHRLVCLMDSGFYASGSPYAGYFAGNVGITGNLEAPYGDFNRVTVRDSFKADSSLWWYCKYMDAINLSPGGSGATQTVPTANTIGGYQFNADTEYLYFNARVCNNWDGLTDLRVEVTWELYDKSIGANDSVFLDLLCWYKGDAEDTTKYQALEVGTLVGNEEQYTQHTSTFTIDYDLANNVVEIDDVFAFRLNLDTAKSDIDDVMINFVKFSYKTRVPHPTTY